MDHSESIPTIARETGLTPGQVAAVEALLDQGATVPFIARYRKEATGSLDEVQVTDIRDRLKQLRELKDRKEAVLKSLEIHGHLDDALKEKVLTAESMATLEDIYLPYRPKRRTRGAIAREKGLEPLALRMFEQAGMDVQTAAEAFVNAEKGVDSIEDALAGARDIIAEMINEEADTRAAMRRLYAGSGILRSQVVAGKEAEGAKYKDYFDWEEPVSAVPSHRMLAMRRGEKEDILNLGIQPPEADALDLLMSRFVIGDGADAEQVALAAKDAFKRLLSRSMETEIRLAAKEKADIEAIRIFAQNLRELLLAPPLGARRTMGVDPGFRTGCKAACLDRQGKLCHHETFYLHQPERAAGQVKQMAARFDIEAIAVGNGTASRETVQLIASAGLPSDIPVVVVNESGASVYSASEVAREEFPDLDLTVRGAVSIGRRLMDPLSELVKIDPKSIGVGQYQHDVDQTALKDALDDVVTSCVNGVGVDVNRASVQLLTYVSGLGPQLARNIVGHRDAHGPFGSRDSLKAVHRLGPKAFEQCAGFLRITDAENPLDASAVHPESYPVVEKMARDSGCTVSDLMRNADLRAGIKISEYVTDAVGLPTLRDIMDELAKPGRDPRDAFETFSFASDVSTLEDLTTGMILPGVVTNVTAFGAFVDIGVHQDGLVHVSELADRFVRDPAEVVKVHQKVRVRVLGVDSARRRISLSMRSEKAPAPRKKKATRAKAAPRKDRPFNNPFSDVLGKMKK